MIDLGVDEAEGVITSYHNAHLQVNLTIAPGVPAPHHHILVKNLNQFETYITMTLRTNDTGIGRVIMEPTMWGACRIFCANSTDSYVISEDLYIEPDGEYYLDITLQDGLVDTNTISGKVRNSTDGSLLSGIKVRFYGQDVMQNDISKEMTTGPDGKFSFTFPDLSRWILISGFGPNHHGRSWIYQYIVGNDSYTLDLTLDPLIGAGDAFTVRFHDAVTGNPLWGDFSISGYSINNGHVQQPSHYLGANATGWHKVPFGAGEYRPQMSLNKKENVTVNLNRFINVNGSGEAFDFGFELPDFRTVKIIVKNETDPIDSASVSYNEYLDHGMMEVHGNGMTLWDGSLYLSLPTDHPTKLYFITYFNEGTEVVYDPSTGSDTLEVELKETGHGSGDSALVTIVPTDEVTGYNLVGDIRFTNDLGWDWTMRTNDTGVLEAEVYPGFYNRIDAVTVMGVGSVENVTLSKGNNPKIVIPIERSDQSSTVHPVYTVKVVNEEGEPLAYQNFKVYIQDPPTFHLLTTDATGTLTFASDEGLVRITRDIDYFEMLPQWTIAGTDLFPDGSGGLLGEITAYRVSPLTEISGFVRDSSTSIPLPHAYIYASSFNDISEGYPDYDAVEFFSMDHGSDDSGFYRIWGMKDVLVESGYDGYYPYREVLDIGSTRGMSHDILLDPVPERNLYVNGTVTDSEGNPLIAWVTAQDEGHPNYNVDYMETGSDGRFSLRLYAGNFNIKCENDTLMANVSITLTENVSGLVMKLVPRSLLTMTVLDWSGSPVDNITIDMLQKEGSEYATSAIAVTDGDGVASFLLWPGTYMFSIDAQMGFSEYTSDEIRFLGWSTMVFEVTLENATMGSISGMVTGDGGPYPDGIGASIVALLEGNATVGSTLADSLGHYLMEDVEFGTYLLKVDAPARVAFNASGRSGYRPYSGNVTIGPIPTVMDVSLDYERAASEVYLNISSRSPTGTGVSLDAPIVLQFSSALDTTIDIIGAVLIDPTIGNLTPELINGNTALRVQHDLFEANTTYTVTVLPLFRSAEGHPMWEAGIIEWSFTTGSGIVEWELYTAVVSSADEDKVVSVTATGKALIDVFIVIEEVGSYALDEVAVGFYAISIPGSVFEYDTTYAYHFSNATNGSDLAPTLAGSFRTPVEPNDWRITMAQVTYDHKDMDWHVLVKGPPGQTIHIVIDGVGSFRLAETSPGNYSVDVPGSNFEWGKEYDYHFSDTEGGAVVPGFETYSGKNTMPEEPKGDNDWDVVMGISCLVILCMLLLLSVVLFFALRKKDGPEDWEE